MCDSSGGGIDGALYTTDSDGNPNVFNVERNDDGSWLNTNWTNPDNRWGLDNVVVFGARNFLQSKLLRLVSGGVLSEDLISPPAKHFSDFLKEGIYCNVLFYFKISHVPQKSQEKFESVQFYYCF